MDAGTLEIRVAVPDDAPALALTTRLGFDSYREWAPEGWEPPPHALEVHSIRERLRRDTTWCAMALQSDGEQAGHVGITHAADRERPHVPLSGRAHLWMLFVRPAWWGSGLAVRLHALGLEEAARQGYETIRLYTPHGAARARSFYEREGWELASRS
jgi:GNAT superfamily N-acetyltransferase